MLNSPVDILTEDRKEAAASLTWTVHLARTEPVKLAICLLACAAASVLGFSAFGNPFPVMITIAALVAALSDFLLPVTYRIGPLGASSTSLLSRRVIRWEEVKACYVDDLGVKLSPIGIRSRREAFRGVYLRFGQEKDAVIEAVRAFRKTSDD